MERPAAGHGPLPHRLQRKPRISSQTNVPEGRGLGLGNAPPFSLLVKPASADCNLRCAYCFYLEKAALYPAAPLHRISNRVLERLVASYMATDQPAYSFGWQGGEPTLMGLEFFQQVVRLQQKHGRAGSVVANGLQTNATLIDDALARHLARYRFLLGVSLDGPRDLHDAGRLSAAGKGTHERVLRGIGMLRHHGVEFNILTAVQSAHRGRGREVYDYLADSGFLFQQYIPIVEFDPAGRPLPFTIRPEDWGEFLCQVFDRWVRSDPLRVSVRQFDAVLARLLDGVAPVCTMGADCRRYFLVEHNGDIYPCDFFVEPGLRLGNIMDREWADLQACRAWRDFGAVKSCYNAACTGCPFLDLCAGDCPRHRYHGSRDPGRLSWLCAGWRMFYEHSLPGFRRLARLVQRERARELREQMGRGLPPPATASSPSC